LEEVCEILDRDSDEPIDLILDAKSDQVTIAYLVQEITENLKLVSQFVKKIEKEVLPSIGVDVSSDLSSLVPNISLREFRLWSMLNIKEFHCSTHLGQSFRQLACAKIEVFPCSDSCMTTQALNEVIDPKIPESVNQAGKTLKLPTVLRQGCYKCVL
jgi:hypothetical protein